MAYYLSYTSSSGKYMQYTALPIAASQSFYIKFEIAVNDSGICRLMGKSGSFSSRAWVSTSAPNFRITDAAGVNADWNYSVSLTTFYIVEFIRTGTSLELKIDGVSQGSKTFGGAFDPVYFFLQNTSVGGGCSIKYVQIDIGGVPNRNYVNSTGTGSEWPDTVGGQNAVEVGSWPADNSEWVFYSSGASNSATISGNLPKLVGSITLNEINPINSATVNGQLPKLAGAVSLLQKQSVTVAGQMPKLTGSASLRLKQSAAVSGQLPRMTGSLSLVSTSNNKQIAVTATMPKMTSSIQLSQELTAAVAGTMPRLTADIQLRLAGVYPQADAGAYVVSYRIAGDAVLTASISESTRFSAIISQSTNIKYMVN